MAERRRQNRANMPSRRPGGIGTTAGSILGVLDALPSARNEEFDPEQAPTGENVPYKRGGMFARMTGSGVRADRQNNDAYDKWVDSKMADEEELRGADLERKMERKGIEAAAMDAGEEPGNWLQRQGKNKLDSIKAKGAEIGALFSTKTNEGEEAENKRKFRADNPDVVTKSMRDEYERTGKMTDAEKRRIDLMGAEQTTRAEQFLKKLEQDNNQFREEIGLRRMATEGELERGNRYNTGDGSVMDIKNGKIFRAGGPRDFKTTRKDALGNDIEITETRNEQPGVYSFGADPAQGGRIKIDMSKMGEAAPNESGATDGDNRPVPLTGNEGKDGNERPLALQAQGGGGNPNGGRPPSWPSEEVRGGQLADLEGKIRPDVIKAEKSASALAERNKSAQLPGRDAGISEGMMRAILEEDEMNADMIGYDKKRIKHKGLGGFKFGS
jgi:hypothetical protein